MVAFWIGQQFFRDMITSEIDVKYFADHWTITREVLYGLLPVQEINCQEEATNVQSHVT